MLVNETRNTTQTHGNVSHGEEEEGHTHTLLTNMVVAGGMAGMGSPQYQRKCLFRSRTTAAGTENKFNCLCADPMSALANL